MTPDGSLGATADITKRERPGLRRILFMAALRLAQGQGLFRAFYARLTARRASTPALVAVMRKLLRIVHARVHTVTATVDQLVAA